MAHRDAFFSIARQRTVVMRALRIAGIVGVVLATLNHGDTILSGQATFSTWAKIALTFLVPYSVSTYSSVMAVREQLQLVRPAQGSALDRPIGS